MSLFTHVGATALLSIISMTTFAAAGDSLGQQAGDFLIDRYHDGRRLLEGPRQTATPAVAPGQSCIALYERRLELLRNMNDYKPAYWDDPRNQAAVFIGTIWTPAFYFLGYSAISAQLDSLNDIDPQVELDALRFASAEQRCFEK